MLSIVKFLAREEGGATAIEYAFIAMLIAVAIVGGVTAIGPGLSHIFTSVSTGF